MKAIFKGTVIAESDNTIIIEGNQYFPPQDVKMEYFEKSDLHTICPWKGQASYYNIKSGDEISENAAWYYPEPKEGSPERVAEMNGKDGEIDYSSYVAFYTDKVDIEE